MILDSLKNWQKYRWDNDRFKAGFEFLEAMKPDLAAGTYEIEGKDLYCMVQAYDTRPVESGEFEAHRDYADIQYLVDGQEAIFWAPQPTLTVTKPYKPDIEFYSQIESPTELVLAPGQFCVFLPEDAHAPCLAHGAPSPVRKAVVKVRL